MWVSEAGVQLYIYWCVEQSNGFSSHQINLFCFCLMFGPLCIFYGQVFIQSHSTILHKSNIHGGNNILEDGFCNGIFMETLNDCENKGLWFKVFGDHEDCGTGCTDFKGKTCLPLDESFRPSPKPTGYDVEDDDFIFWDDDNKSIWYKQP